MRLKMIWCKIDRWIWSFRTLDGLDPLELWTGWILWNSWWANSLSGPPWLWTRRVLDECYLLGSTSVRVCHGLGRLTLLGQLRFGSITVRINSLANKQGTNSFVGLLVDNFFDYRQYIELRGSQGLNLDEVTPTLKSDFIGEDGANKIVESRGAVYLLIIHFYGPNRYSFIPTWRVIHRISYRTHFYVASFPFCHIYSHVQLLCLSKRSATACLSISFG